MKPGLKTTELWLAIFANVLVYAGGLNVPDKFKVYTTAATAVGYALSRGLAKLNAAPVNKNTVGLVSSLVSTVEHLVHKQTPPAPVTPLPAPTTQPK